MAATVPYLLSLVDEFSRASGGVADKTLSYRLFGDSKKVTALRVGGDITLSRYNDALRWLADNWPEGIGAPDSLSEMLAEIDRWAGCGSPKGLDAA